MTDGKKPRRSRRTPVAGTPAVEGDPAMPKPRRSRKTPVAGTPEAAPPVAAEAVEEPLPPAAVAAEEPPPPPPPAAEEPLPPAAAAAEEPPPPPPPAAEEPPPPPAAEEPPPPPAAEEPLPPPPPAAEVPPPADDAAVASAPTTFTESGRIERRIHDRRRTDGGAAEEPRATAVDFDDPEAASMPAPEPLTMSLIPPPVVPPPKMPDPAAAAFEAARIAGEIVGDIGSASGAAIVAAAAAGAAIEAARARSRAGHEGDSVLPALADAPPALDPANTDPVITVRMQRDRILRALADDVAAQATTAAGGDPSAGHDHPQSAAHSGHIPVRRSGSHAIPRASSQGDAADELHDDDGLDPVQIAAAAIQRLRQRASTDFAELRVHYHRHDILVLVAAFAIIVIAGRVHTWLTTPPTKRFEQRGLVFHQSASWLEPEPMPPPPPRIVRDPTGQPPRADAAYRAAFTSSVEAGARLEVVIDKKPGWSNIVTNLELERRNRWGELYALDRSTVRSIEGHNWLRTAFRYAHAPDKGDVPRVDRAVEYATIDREQIYVITMFGTPAQLERIEEVIAPTLRVPTRSGMPLVPQTRSLAQRSYPNAIARAFDSTVMVVVADLVDGKLQARGGAAGVIVGKDGSILTNYHVIHDKGGRLHDVFLIGRFAELTKAPQLQCAGRPNRSKLQREKDLALIKCDTDLDGRTWTPAIGAVWKVLPELRADDVRIGQRLWVLGYPDVGGGGLTLSEGEIEGWTGPDGSTGRDFIKTDASITHGNSGGPVVDDHGRLVGVASASRTRLSGSGTVIESSHSHVGLLRPLATASDLLAIAQAGWTPREGHTDVELQPSAVEAPAEGLRLVARVVDTANQAAIRDALVMVLRPGIAAGQVDVNRLDDQVLAWGRSNSQGEVQLKQPVPVPGSYTVMVVARGYETLIGEGALQLAADTPLNADPLGELRLRAR